MKKQIKDMTFGECMKICENHECNDCPLSKFPTCIWAEISAEEFNAEVEISE